MKKVILSRRKNSLRLKDFDYATPSAYFITICSYEGKKVFSDKDLAKEIIKCLKENKEKTNLKMYIYCLMPDHLHILLNPGDSNVSISRFIQTFKSQAGFLYKKTKWNPFMAKGLL